MCVQWCHRRQFVIDNDWPCDCPEPIGVCAGCCHRRESVAETDVSAASDPWCALTQQPLPLAGGCCHANVAVALPEVLPLATLPVAPWVLTAWDVMDGAALIAIHPNAIPITEHAGAAGIATADLATPMVYGVAAEAWMDALPPLLSDPTPLPPLVEVGLTLLDRLNGPDAEREAARVAWEQAYTTTPLACIPLAWRSWVDGLAALCAEVPVAEGDMV